jgi:hypothetical protein
VTYLSIIFVLSPAVTYGGLVDYQNAQYLQKHKCGHRDTLNRPLSVEVTVSQKVSCIVIASYTHSFVTSQTKCAVRIHSPYGLDSISRGWLLRIEQPIPSGCSWYLQALRVCVWVASRSSWPWRARNAVDRSERKMAETVSVDQSGFNQSLCPYMT